jgi:hemerythrin
MSAFAWDESYSVRVSKFDRQHQKLFEIINSLADAMRMGKGQDVIRPVVEQLAIYTRTHFLQEEMTMKETGYPGFAAHKEQHAKLMAEVEKYKRDLDTGREPNSVGVLNFLRNWLTDHIRRCDKAYSDHLNARGIR